MILQNSGHPNGSPSCVHFVKNLNARRFVNQYLRAVECIQNEHLDYMLTSAETEAKAEKLIEKVRFIHFQGDSKSGIGYRIHTKSQSVCKNGYQHRRYSRCGGIGLLMRLHLDYRRYMVRYCYQERGCQ